MYKIQQTFFSILLIFLILHCRVVESQLVKISGKIYDKVITLSIDGKTFTTTYTPVNTVNTKSNSPIILSQTTSINSIPLSISSSTSNSKKNNNNLQIHGNNQGNQGHQNGQDNQNGQGNQNGKGNNHGNNNSKNSINTIDLTTNSLSSTTSTFSQISNTNSNQLNSPTKTTSIPLAMTAINSDTPTFSIGQADTPATLMIDSSILANPSLNTSPTSPSEQPPQNNDNSQPTDTSSLPSSLPPSQSSSSQASQSTQTPTLALTSSIFGIVDSPFTQLRTTTSTLTPDANNNLSTDPSNSISGVDNVVDGLNNDLIGNKNVINVGNNNTIRGDQNVIANGNNNIIMSDGSLVMGNRNIIY